jgi:transposase
LAHAAKNLASASSRLNCDSRRAVRRAFRQKIWFNQIVTNHPDPLPSDLAAAHALILAQREMLAAALSESKVRALEIERLKLMLAKARREKFGQSSERGKLLIEQLEFAIADLEETHAEEETKAEMAAAGPQKEKRTRSGVRRPSRPLPDNLPRERVLYPAPCA